MISWRKPPAYKLCAEQTEGESADPRIVAYDDELQRARAIPLGK